MKDEKLSKLIKALGIFLFGLASLLFAATWSWTFLKSKINHTLSNRQTTSLVSQTPKFRLIQLGTFRGSVAKISEHLI